MEQITFLLDDYRPQATTCKSERADVIKQFVDAINAEKALNKWRYKVGDTWKKSYPVTGRGIAIKCSHMKNISELYGFLSDCKQARSFGEWFNGRLKVSNHKKNEQIPNSRNT